MIKAIENARSGITIFKGGEVFAFGRKVTECNGRVGIQLLPEFYHLLPDLGADIPKKWIHLHYSMYSGVFLDAFEDTPEIDKVFEDTLAVDTFNLYFGMVPDTFRDFQGYCDIDKEFKE